MKISKKQLQNIINEEIHCILYEQAAGSCEEYKQTLLSFAYEEIEHLKDTDPEEFKRIWKIKSSEVIRSQKYSPTSACAWKDFDKLREKLDKRKANSGIPSAGDGIKEIEEMISILQGMKEWIKEFEKLPGEGESEEQLVSPIKSLTRDAIR